jgi:hypothetical protein
VPRFWDLTTERGKRNLIIKARQLGMLDFSPDDGRREPKLRVPLEHVEEIGHLMRQAPGHYKENVRTRNNDK